MAKEQVPDIPMHLHTHTVQVPSHNQVIPLKDSAASAMLQETALLSSMDFNKTVVKFEGESSKLLELAMAAAVNP